MEYRNPNHGETSLSRSPFVRDDKTSAASLSGGNNLDFGKKEWLLFHLQEASGLILLAPW